MNNFIWYVNDKLHIDQIFIPDKLIEKFWNVFSQIPIPHQDDVNNFINYEENSKIY